MSRLRPHRLAHRYRAGARSLTGRNRIWHDLRLERLDQLLLLRDALLENLQLGFGTEQQPLSASSSSPSIASSTASAFSTEVRTV